MTVCFLYKYAQPDFIQDENGTTCLVRKHEALIVTTSPIGYGQKTYTYVELTPLEGHPAIIDDSMKLVYVKTKAALKVLLQWVQEMGFKEWKWVNMDGGANG